jgi:hypothetical protein
MPDQVNDPERPEPLGVAKTTDLQQLQMVNFLREGHFA